VWAQAVRLRHTPDISQGYNNTIIDQYNLCTEPIREEWVIGVARFRMPYIGYVHITLLKIVKIVGMY